MLNTGKGNPCFISWISVAHPDTSEPQPSWPGVYPDLASAGDDDNVADSASDKPPGILTQDTKTPDTSGDIKDGSGVSHTEQSHSLKPGHVEKKVCSKL